MEQLLEELELAVRAGDQAKVLGLLSRLQARVEHHSSLASTVECALAELSGSDVHRDLRRFAERIRGGFEDWRDQS